MITAMPRIAIAAQNFEQLLGLFRDKLHMPVLDLSEMSRNEYGAALAMCVPPGGSNIELMSPVDPHTPLCRSLQGFIDRRGVGLFALMLEAPVPDEEAEQLAARGLNIMPLMPGAFGRDVHPNSTHGVLIRVYPVDSFKGRYQGEPDRRAPQLSGIVRVIVAVADIGRAAAAYGKGFGLMVDPIVEDRARGVAVARCHPPKGGVIELVSVRDESRPSPRPSPDICARTARACMRWCCNRRISRPPLRPCAATASACTRQPTIPLCWRYLGPMPSAP